jgi:hypothetical protein
MNCYDAVMKCGEAGYRFFPKTFYPSATILVLAFKIENVDFAAGGQLYKNCTSTRKMV